MKKIQQLLKPKTQTAQALEQRRPDETVLVQEKLAKNPLIRAIRKVLGQIESFRQQARSFYFEVILSAYQCPECGGRLQMTGQSQCACLCGNTFDPTISFQKSTCCGAKLVKKTFHYACSRCRESVPSRFLFDERVFDAAYFREMMRESREKAKRRKEEIRRFLAESRSSALPLMDYPLLESIPGLIQDLDDFVRGGALRVCYPQFDAQSEFSMDDYHNHIMSALGWDSILFSDIAPLIHDHRRDRVWRFVTLIFMQNDREVELTQDGTDISVQKVYNEAYS
jgi:hypothetical protein